MLKSLKAILLQLESKHSLNSELNDCTAKFIITLTKFINHLLDSSISSLVDGLDEILKHFYKILCYPPKTESKTALSEVRSCFFKAFEQNLQDNMPEKAEELFKDENTLLFYVLNEMKNLVMSESCTFSKIIELSDLVDNILLIVYKTSPSNEDCNILLDHSFMLPTLQKLLPTEYEWEQMEAKLSPLYVTPSILLGTFICREFPLPHKCQDTPLWDQSFIKASLFLVRIMMTLCSYPPTNDIESPKDDLDEGSVSLGQFLHLVNFALHAACHSFSMVQMNNYLNNVSINLAHLYTVDVNMPKQADNTILLSRRVQFLFGFDLIETWLSFHVCQNFL